MIDLTDALTLIFCSAGQLVLRIVEINRIRFLDANALCALIFDFPICSQMPDLRTFEYINNSLNFLTNVLLWLFASSHFCALKRKEGRASSLFCQLGDLLPLIDGM